VREFLARRDGKLLLENCLASFNRIGKLVPTMTKGRKNRSIQLTPFCALEQIEKELKSQLTCQHLAITWKVRVALQILSFQKTVSSTSHDPKKIVT
jgi:hypothetical protein